MGLISNFPGGGKKPVGTALTKDVLLGKTFSNDTEVGVSGDLMVSKGAVAPDTLNSWSLRSSADNSWLSVCYGNGLFVAVAYSGIGNRVMTASAPLQLAQAGSMKNVQALGNITATYVSATQIKFNLKPYVSDISIISVENIVAQFQQIHKTTTTYTPVFTWTYDNSTGILTCTASYDLFGTDAAIAKIYIIM